MVNDPQRSYDPADLNERQMKEIEAIRAKHAIADAELRAEGFFLSRNISIPGGTYRETSVGFYYALPIARERI